MTLEPCDLIMTGTLIGSSKIERGDVVEGGLEQNNNKVVQIKFNVE